MYKMSRLKKYVITAMCITLCTVLPLVLHAIPGGGNVISPMHIPVLLCGLIAGWYFGLLSGLFGPLLSSFVTGMPTMAYTPSMMVELAAYGAITGLLIRFVQTKNQYANLYICLVAAMLIGRVLAGISRALMFAPGTYTMALWVGGYFIRSLPGIIIQLILIPIIIVALEKSRLLQR